MKITSLHHRYCKLILCVIIAVLYLPVSGTAQKTIQQVEAQVNDMHGVEKLVAYHQLIEYYNNIGQDKKALRFARRAIDLTESIIMPENKLLDSVDYYLKPKTYLLAGEAFEDRAFYVESKESYEIALQAAEELQNADQISEARYNIGRLDSLILYTDGGKKSFLGSTISDIESVAKKSTNDIGATATLKIAERNEEEGEYEKAIENYKSILSHYKDAGDWESVTEIRLKIAELYEKLENYDDALVELREARIVFERAGDTSSLDVVLPKIDTLSSHELRTSDPLPARKKLNTIRDSMSSASHGMSPAEMVEIQNEAKDIKTIAEEAEKSDDYERSLYYYKEYMEIQQMITEQQRLQELALLDRAHQIDTKDKTILLLKQKEDLIELELITQKEARKNLVIVLVLLGVILSSLYFMYRNKKRDHNKLGVAYENLSVAQVKLQTADAKIKQLLSQQISGAVATALLSSENAGKVERRFVCIMFLDIRNFTVFAEKLLPEEIISYQNNVFAFMIESIIKHGGIVNQLLGDGFMATFGAPVSNGNDALNAYQAAREIMETVSEKSHGGEIPMTRVGIGLHAGDVVTGNVGTEQRKQYSITGNTVIIAARLEQLNKEFGSTMVLSREVYSRLPEDMQEPVEFKEVMVKGRSEPVEVAAYYHGSKHESTVGVNS